MAQVRALEPDFDLAEEALQSMIEDDGDLAFWIEGLRQASAIAPRRARRPAASAPPRHHADQCRTATMAGAFGDLGFVLAQFDDVQRREGLLQ